MSKYMNDYNKLMEQKASLKKMHSRLYNQYGHLMSDNAKTLNEANWSITENMYDRDIAIAQRKALQEMEDEAVERIMKRVSVEVQDNTSKPLQDLEKQIKNLFSK